MILSLIVIANVVRSTSSFSSTDEITFSDMWINGESSEAIYNAFAGVYSAEMIEQEISKRTRCEPEPTRLRESWRKDTLHKGLLLNNIDGTRVDEKDTKEIKRRIALSYGVPLEKVKYIKRVGHKITFKILSHQTEPDVFFTPVEFCAFRNCKDLLGISDDDLRNHPVVQEVLSASPVSEKFLNRLSGVEREKGVEVVSKDSLYLRYTLLEGIIDQLENDFDFAKERSKDKGIYISSERLPEECPVCLIYKFLAPIKCAEGDDDVYHSVCSKCISEWTRADAYQCPLCRHSHGAQIIDEVLQNEKKKLVIVED